MQIFVLDSDPTAAAQQLVDVHVGSQLRESVQMLYTVLHSYGEPVTEPFPGPDKPLEPYKPYMPHHPCTVWAGAARSHFNWLLAHAGALAREWQQRRGETHLCAYHVDHIHNTLDERAPHSYPCAMPRTIDHNDWLHGLSEKKRVEWTDRIACVQPPNGCEFGILAMEPTYRVFDECVRSYQKLYEYKLTKPTVTRLGKRGRAPQV